MLRLLNIIGPEIIGNAVNACAEQHIRKYLRDEMVSEFGASVGPKLADLLIK